MVLRPRKNKHVSNEAVDDLHLNTSTENNSFPRSNASIPRNFSSNYFNTITLKEEQKKDPPIQKVIDQLR